MSGNNTNPQVSVTNNSGVSVEIYDVYNPSTESGIYTYTKLATIESGSTANIQTIRAATHLVASYTGSITLATVSTDVVQFPVASLGVSILDTPPLSWTISADDYTGAQQAFLFAKYSNANPDSVTATSFNTALTKSTDDSGAAVNTFFAGTGSFPKATYNAWVQIISWQSQSLSPWTGVYYLYSTDSNAPKGTDPVQLQAVVEITQSGGQVAGDVYATSNADNYKSGQHTTITQSGKGPITSSGSDLSLSLTVTPVWASIRSVDSKGNVSYNLNGAMTGTFNNISVSGSTNKMTPPSRSGSGSSQSGLQNYLEWQSAIGGLFGNLVSFAMLAIMFKEYKMKTSEAKDKAVNNDPKASKEELENAQKEAVDKVAAETDKQISDRQTNLDKSREELKANREALATAEDRVKVGEAIESSTESVDKLLTEGPSNPEIDKAVETTVQAKEDLANGKFDDAFEKMTSVNETIQKAVTESGDQLNEEQKKAADDLKKTMEEEQARQEEQRKAEEEAQEARDQKPDDKIPERELEGGGEEGGGE